MLKEKKVGYVIATLGKKTVQNSFLNRFLSFFFKTTRSKNDFFFTLQKQLFHFLDAPLLPFSLDDKSSHRIFYSQIQKLNVDRVRMISFSPQFSYQKSGFLAKVFAKNLPSTLLKKSYWIHSYSSHPLFIQLWQKLLKEFLEKKEIKEEDTLFVFLAEKMQKSNIFHDPYSDECENSTKLIIKSFPMIEALLIYKPKRYSSSYSNKIKELMNWQTKRKNILFIHLTHLFEEVMDISKSKSIKELKKRGFFLYELKLADQKDWLKIFSQIMQEDKTIPNQMLLLP